MLLKKQNMAFTLAEVLIVLAIIGVVAAITLPGIIASTQKIEFVSKLKKDYSTLFNAYNMLAANAGGSIMNVPGFSSSTGSTADCKSALDALTKQMHIIKNCGPDKGCWYGQLKLLSGTIAYDDWEETNDAHYAKAILADGTMIMVIINDTNCIDDEGPGPLAGSVCGNIYLDVNGKSGPNQFGRDVFFFWITQKGIYPAGTTDPSSCDMNSSEVWTSIACTAKVLKEGAMNY